MTPECRQKLMTQLDSFNADIALEKWARGLIFGYGLGSIAEKTWAVTHGSYWLERLFSALILVAFLSVIDWMIKKRIQSDESRRAILRAKLND